MAEIARDLGINEGTLGSWVSREKESGQVKDKPLDINERARLRELEEENRRLRMERDFLKKQPRGLRRRASKVRVHRRAGGRGRAQATRGKAPGRIHVRDAGGIATGVLPWRNRGPSARQLDDEKLAVLIAEIHDGNAGRYGMVRH
jgi:transposase-like protein